MPESQARSANVADFTLKVGDLTTDDLRVTAFEGTEGLSRLFEFRVRVTSENPDIDIAALIGKPAVLEIGGPSGSRFVNGIVRRFERVGEGTNQTRYAATIVPAHWLLTRRQRSRVFQNITVPDIIKKVLTDAGIPDNMVRFATQGSPKEREFVVQYRESEMDFISRLMEEEGIFYFFEHAVDNHKMVFGNSDVAHADCPLNKELVYREPTNLLPDADQEYIYELRDSAEIQTASVSLDDFDFVQPGFQLRRTKDGQQFTTLDFDDYPGNYVKKELGDHFANVRLQAYQARKRRLRMSATARGLLAGYKFTLKEHPSDPLNQAYVVTELHHDARQQQAAREEADSADTWEYRADFETLPADIPYRAPITTPRPVVHGSQTALVVGPSGEEIYTDKYGRVKAQFHWDQEGQYNDTSSCWIRVSQGAAGGQYGMMFLPRIGQEVVVSFLEGNPDRPLITGRVYNGDQMPPYPLPDEKTKSTIKTHSSPGGGGTNEIRFEDAKDKEQILIYAQKDLHLRAKASRLETIGGSRHLTVYKDKFELVKENRHTEIKLDSNEKIGGKMSLEVKGDLGTKISGGHAEETTGDIYLKSKKNVIIEGAMQLTLKVGGNFVVIDSTGVSISGTMVKINSGGSAGSGQAIAPTAPEAPQEADTVEPGKDTSYNPDAVPPPQVDLEQQSFTAVEVPTDEPEETSWIEIELVDEADQPVPGERYKVVTPDGKEREGTLDQNGRARISGIKPGSCQITFPRLDLAAWERS